MPPVQDRVHMNSTPVVGTLPVPSNDLVHSDGHIREEDVSMQGPATEEGVAEAEGECAKHDDQTDATTAQESGRMDEPDNRGCQGAADNVEQAMPGIQDLGTGTVRKYDECPSQRTSEIGIGRTELYPDNKRILLLLNTALITQQHARMNEVGIHAQQ